jgi:hypothetical protein
MVVEDPKLGADYKTVKLSHLKGCAAYHVKQDDIVVKPLPTPALGVQMGLLLKSGPHPALCAVQAR